MNKEPFLPSISPEELHALPPIEFAGQITLVDRIKYIGEAADFLNSQKILGFDTETKPSFKKGQINSVSLLQLSASDRVFLFRLNKTGLPVHLAQILANPKILKIGAAIRDDIRILQKLQRFVPAGFIDLQDIVTNYGIENKGVRKLAGIILKGRISKSQQLTNWEAPDFTESQKLYAATDAWVCLKMYEKLMEYNHE
jgi:ribonuclease D